MKLCKVREYSLPLFAGILIAMIMVNVNSDFYYEVIYKPNGIIRKFVGRQLPSVNYFYIGVTSPYAPSAYLFVQ